MNLTELAPVPAPALPLAQLKDHLRLGTGFADDSVQDALAEGYLRAAIAAVEGRSGKALIARDFALVLAGWRDEVAQALPLAPVLAIVSLTLRDRDGTATPVAADRWRLRRDGQRPRLTGAGAYLPAIPVGGEAEIVLTGGYGPWEAVPADLRQAVMLLAAHFHEHRHDGAAGGLPAAVTALIEPWRQVRVLGGGAA